MKEPKEQKQIEFFDALIASKGDVRKAAEEVGYTRVYAYELARKYRDYLNERTRGIFHLEAVRAANKLIDALDSDGTNAGEKTQVDAAKDVLDRAGVSKQEQFKLDVESNKGIFILPAKEINADDQETDK